MFTEQLEKEGFKLDIQQADQDVETQKKQIEAMVDNGDKVIVIGSVDGTQLGDSLEKAKKAGVYIIGYDRMIEKTACVDGVVQFGSVKTGELQAQALLEGLEKEKGKYFESFPHHLCFETNMRNDVELLDRFSKNGASDPEIFQNTSFKQPINILRHAACVPIYPMLKDRLIQEDSPVYYMVSGKCFRNEDKNVEELSRLNEFYMKEYVCIGTLEQTQKLIEEAKELWKYWIDRFSWQSTIETANDSFFANNYKKLKIFQIMGSSKQELRVVIPHNGTSCAVSSANMHRTHFTKVYNIHSEHALCSSSCFAFGIERLSYALLCQKCTFAKS